MNRHVLQRALRRVGAAAVLVGLVGVPVLLGASAASAAPIEPVIDSPATGETFSDGDFVNVYGSGTQSGSQLEVFLDDVSVCSFPISEGTDGTWYCGAGSAGAEGEHVLRVQQTDFEGATTAGQPVTFSVAPAPTLTVADQQANYDVVPGDTLTLSGTCPRGTYVEASMTSSDGGDSVVWSCPDVEVPNGWACSVTIPDDSPFGSNALSIRAVGEGVTDSIDSITVTVVDPTPAPDPVPVPVPDPGPVPDPLPPFIESVVPPILTKTTPATAAPTRPKIEAEVLPGLPFSAETRDTPVPISNDAADDVSESVPIEPGGERRDPRNEPGAPNSLSESIQPFSVVFTSPLAIGASIIAGLAFLVLVAFPSELLSAAVKDRYRFMDRRMPRPNGAWLGVSAWFSRRPTLSGVALVALATVIAGFADPEFGPDLASVRLLLACFIAAMVVSYGSYAITNRLMNRRWSLPTSIVLRPFTIVITVVGVVLSRVLDFSPGFLFGLILGLSFPAATSVAMRSRGRMVRTVLIIAMAVASWIVYSVVLAFQPAAPVDFSSALVRDTLAALSTEGLTGMLIALLPFLYMEGQEIWQHSKRQWAVLYAGIVVVFFVVVAPKPESWANLGEKYAPWALVLVCYAAAALAAYVALRWSERHGGGGSAGPRRASGPTESTSAPEPAVRA